MRRAIFIREFHHFRPTIGVLRDPTPDVVRALGVTARRTARCVSAGCGEECNRGAIIGRDFERMCSRRFTRRAQLPSTCSSQDLLRSPSRSGTSGMRYRRRSSMSSCPQNGTTSRPPCCSTARGRSSFLGGTTRANSTMRFRRCLLRETWGCWQCSASRPPIEWHRSSESRFMLASGSRRDGTCGGRDLVSDSACTTQGWIRSRDATTAGWRASPGTPSPLGSGWCSTGAVSSNGRSPSSSPAGTWGTVSIRTILWPCTA